MDIWKYFDITHKHHVLCNPTNLAKLDDIIALLDLKPGAQVVEIACGKGEMLARLAEWFSISGIGIDKSPYCIADAREKLRQRAPSARIQLMHMDGADYSPESPESFDLAMCIGASWIYNGHRDTLRALKAMTKPGGLILVGEPYWMQEPSEEYLEADGEIGREDFGSHHDNVVIGEEEGLVPLYAAASSQDDWDRYETLQWYATNDYVTAHPDDPDVTELLAMQSKARRLYLKWARDTLGWALYLFRKPVGTP